MIEADIERFEAALLELGGKVGKGAPTEVAVAAWFKTLIEYPIEAVEAAIAEVGNTWDISTWPPVAKVLDVLQEDEQLEAEESWDRCMKKMQGDYDIELNDIDEETRRIVGNTYHGFGNWRESERHFAHKQFVEIHAALKRRAWREKVKALTAGPSKPQLSAGESKSLDKHG